MLHRFRLFTSVSLLLRLSTSQNHYSIYTCTLKVLALQNVTVKDGRSQEVGL